MYELLLTVHSSLRWAVLVLLVVQLLAGPRWARGPFWLVLVADLQVTLGAVLWLFVSPLMHLAVSQGLLFSGGLFTFFGLFHPTVMLVALTWLHVGKVRLKRSQDWRCWRNDVRVAFALILLAIPWPFWSFGRALFRGVAA
ncbi:MAG: hypothetical protein JNK82_30075 [Myxococcaceae bacterium]|nr:hypothetical protein [Myxococcaceae bacterium]